MVLKIGTVKRELDITVSLILLSWPVGVDMQFLSSAVWKAEQM